MKPYKLADVLDLFEVEGKPDTVLLTERITPPNSRPAGGTQYPAHQDREDDMDKELEIVMLRDDKLHIKIRSTHIDQHDREFSVIVDYDGITINGDENLAVYPAAVNVVRIDYAA